LGPRSHGEPPSVRRDRQPPCRDATSHEGAPTTCATFPIRSRHRCRPMGPQDQHGKEREALRSRAQGGSTVTGRPCAGDARTAEPANRRVGILPIRTVSKRRAGSSGLVRSPLYVRQKSACRYERKRPFLETECGKVYRANYITLYILHSKHASPPLCFLQSPPCCYGVPAVLEQKTTILGK
jgi:hypothetical protein